MSVREFIYELKINNKDNTLISSLLLSSSQYVEMLALSKVAAVTVLAVLVSDVLAVQIKFPLRSGQQGNRMVTVDSDGNRFRFFFKILIEILIVQSEARVC